MARDYVGAKAQWIVFLAPGALLAVMFVVELMVLRDRPSDAGLEDFVTGWASGAGAGTAGRPAALAVGPEGALYVSDPPGGRIWRVSYVGPAGSP